VCGDSSPHTSSTHHRPGARDVSDYLFSDHVYLRAFGSSAILLDLKRDEYLLLDADQIDLLNRAVRGWPQSPARSFTTEIHDSKAHELIDTLKKRDLLTQNDRLGKPAAQCEVSVPTSSIVDLPDVIRRPSLAKGVSALWACISTYYALRTRRLDELILDMRRQKSNAQSKRRDVVKLAQDFLFSRPFFYTADNNCLFESLALTRFLASCGVFATMVVACRIDPFVAHAWVQHDNLILNDTAENVRSFAPIMVL
jgi:hypothetical protein